MIFIVVLGIIGFILAMWAVGYLEEDWFAGFFMGLMFAMIGGLIGALIAMGVGAFVHPDTGRVKEPVAQIVSLRDEVHTSGTFALGSGSVNSEPVFYYYVETHPNTFVKRWVPASRTTIVEDSSAESAYLESSRMTWLTEPNHAWTITFAPSADMQYTFHVPEGTVIQEMQVR